MASSLAASAGSSNASNHLLQFRRPFGGNRDEGKIFPPVVYTDATYSNGILVANDTRDDNNAALAAAGGNEHNLEEVSLSIPGNYFANTGQLNEQVSVPSLSKDEAARWADSHSAHAAAKRRRPMQIGRLLGVISLGFEERVVSGRKKSSKSNNLLDKSKKYNDQYHKKHNTGGFRRQPSTNNGKFTKAFSKKQALVEACTQLGIDPDVADITSSLPNHALNHAQRELVHRADEISEYWKNIKQSPPLEECWNVQTGGFVREALGASASYNGTSNGNDGEEYHVPIHCILDWLKKDNTVTDVNAGRIQSLYNGLREIPTDAKSILESLVDLSCPKSLYKIPLITPYAVVARHIPSGQQHQGGNLVSWKIRIGVYMNRLLPEVLTSNNLHIVMSALDEGSYIVSEPLHMPPMRDRNDPVFQSSQYPIVTMPGEEEKCKDLVDGKVDDDVSMGGEEKKVEDEDVPMDPTVIGSTRESKTISPFTPKGLLKLMENTGNDISMYPELAQKLAPYLKLNLMLHQKHALCWMTQMEHLAGFGINSIIWEEREFLDGGKYYYSPALGQIRLNRPPLSLGGCVADEMGLGKTLMMVALIASSMDEIKQGAVDGGECCTHATLIIVPPALVMQWVNEIGKSCGGTLNVNVLDANCTKIDADLVESGGVGCDVVVTTYNALEKPKTSKFLATWGWGRIVLDEQQEIRSSTTTIARNCESLNCHRRWMLSGTPIFEGIDDLRGELNFLRLSPYASQFEDGFFNFSILNHWALHSKHGLETLRILGLLILRRSKDMTICATGNSIMDQRKLTVELVPIAQSDSERALYCWFEYLVSQELQRQDGDESSDTKKNLQSRALCLRLLKEICFSAVMVNGGLGVSPQLKVLNGLYRKLLSRMEKKNNQAARHKDKKKESTRVLSPLQALRYLSQAERQANVGEEFISDQQFSRGQGASNRTRAVDGLEEQVQKAQHDVEEATKKEAEAKSKRAKARWHLALELVTTGALCDKDEIVECLSPKMALLWKYRRLCIESEVAVGNKGIALFQRGWRPSSNFPKDVLASNPSFHWAKPGCLQINNIPSQVSVDDIQMAVFEGCKKEPKARSRLEALRKKYDKATKLNEKVQSDIAKAEDVLNQAIAHDRQLQQPTVVKVAATKENWIAYLEVADEEYLLKQAQSAAGISLRSTEAIPDVEAALVSAAARYDQAVAEANVHPCQKNMKEKGEAKKALDRAKLGLLITTAPSSSSTNVIISPAMGSIRGTAPRTASALVEGSHASIAQASYSLERALSRLQNGRSALARLTTALNRGVQDISQKSAYEVLEALRQNDFESTFCPICLANFGDSAGDDPTVEAKIVAMISCGHFYCIKCLDEHVHAEINRNAHEHKCPSCRAGFIPGDVMHIDHLDKSDEEEIMAKRSEAKAKIRQASDMLANSDGVLDGELWNSLFLSINVPSHVSAAPHRLHTALPRELLAHFRAATGMNVDSAKSDQPFSWSSDSLQNNTGLSSKIQALLRDLPHGEHAVVFSSSKEGVLHIDAVLKAKDIDCLSLYTGQHTKATEECVSSWKNARTDTSKAGPVLVVQAGAAASGLTLTTACKLFLMEPFSRQEEEQQAYARLHRYGQKKDVHVKIYFTPVSVESRLLRWRKRSMEKLAEAGDGSSNYVFSQLLGEDGEDTDARNADDDGTFEEIYDEEEEGEDEEDSNENEINEDVAKDSVEGGEDSMRTQFLLGLVDEDGNPTLPNLADNQVGRDDGVVSARRFILE